MAVMQIAVATCIVGHLSREAINGKILVVTVFGDVVEWEAGYDGEFKALLRLE